VKTTEHLLVNTFPNRVGSLFSYLKSFVNYSGDECNIISPGIGVIDPRMISVMSVRASDDFHQSENISESITLINLKVKTQLEKAI